MRTRANPIDIPQDICVVIEIIGSLAAPHHYAIILYAKTCGRSFGKSI